MNMVNALWVLLRRSIRDCAFLRNRSRLKFAGFVPDSGIKTVTQYVKGAFPFKPGIKGCPL